MNANWQQVFFLISAAAGVLSFVIGVYQLRRQQPHRLAAKAFMALGILVGLAIVVIYCFGGVANSSGTANSSELVRKQYKYFKTLTIEGDVTALAFTQYGRLLVIGTGDGRILVWDTSSHEIVNSIAAHSKEVANLSFSADGQFLASASSDQTVKIWHFPTGVPEAILKQENSYKFKIPIAFSPNRQLLAVGGYETMALYRLDQMDSIRIASDKKMASPNTGFSSAIMFTPDGTFCALVGQNALISVWNTDDWTMHRIIKAHSEIKHISISPAGLLASTGDDKAITLWNLATGEPQRTLTHHGESYSALAFNGEILAAAVDKKVSLWDVHTGDLLEDDESGQDYFGISRLVFSSDNGKFLAAGGHGYVALFTREATR